MTLNSYAGLQGRMVGEAAHAACVFSADEANEIISRLFAAFEADLPHAPKGLTFDRCYDLGSVQPTREYADLYSRTRETLAADYGLSFTL